MTNSFCSSSIDWAATGAMLQGWATLAGAGAVVWAAYKGASTFDGWRRQKIAERKQEQAERILTATYKCRRALEYVRGWMLFGHERHAAEQQIKQQDGWSQKSQGLQNRLVTGQAFYNRLNRIKAERAELDQCFPMARALFGEELEQALENLSHQFWIVQVNVDSYIDDEDGTDKDFTDKIHRVMYAVTPRDGEVNEVTHAVETSVAAIERICLPVLRLEAQT